MRGMIVTPKAELKNLRENAMNIKDKDDSAAGRRVNDKELKDLWENQVTGSMNYYLIPRSVALWLLVAVLVLLACAALLIDPDDLMGASMLFFRFIVQEFNNPTNYIADAIRA